MTKLLWRFGLVALIAAAMTACGPSDLTKLLEKHAKIIDLSHPLTGDSPHWPGESYFGLRIDTLATIERDGVLSLAFHFPEHYGTHVDAPNHFAAGQIPVDKITPENLFAPMVVLDISETAAKNADYLLEKEDIVRWENIHGTIPDGAIVFINTGWARRWNDPEAYRNADKDGVMHFPAYGEAAARFLVHERRVKAIGIDNLSIDRGISTDFAVHKIVNGAGVYALENVANLDKAPPRNAYAVIAPIKIKGGTGGPARIFAIVP
jgi:kynurenine formamidase